MTETIHCKNCEFLLYYGETIADRLYIGGLSEEKVLKRYKNVCPNCEAPLGLETVEIKFKEW